MSVGLQQANVLSPPGQCLLTASLVVFRHHAPSLAKQMTLRNVESQQFLDNLDLWALHVAGVSSLQALSEAQFQSTQS